MSDLVEFLRARLDEDEAMARAAVEIRARVYGGQFESDLTFKAWDDHPAGTVIVGPERVLREVEAKRQIVDEIVRRADYSASGYGMERLPGVTLAVMAAIYADHPDYRDEWA